MKLSHETIDNLAKTALIGGTGSGGTVMSVRFMDWIAESADAMAVILAAIMATIAFAGLVVTWHFKNEENKRKRHAHIEKYGPIPDKIEGTDNDGTP